MTIVFVLLRPIALASPEGGAGREWDLPTWATTGPRQASAGPGVVARRDTRGCAGASTA